MKIISKELQALLKKHNLTLADCTFKNTTYNVFGKTIVGVNTYSYNNYINALKK